MGGVGGDWRRLNDDGEVKGVGRNKRGRHIITALRTVSYGHSENRFYIVHVWRGPG